MNKQELFILNLSIFVVILNYFSRWLCLHFLMDISALVIIFINTYLSILIFQAIVQKTVYNLKILHEYKKKISTSKDFNTLKKELDSKLIPGIRPFQTYNILTIIFLQFYMYSIMRYIS